MEIVAQWGQLPACAQCFHIHVDYDHGKVLIAITVSLFVPMMVGINLIVSLFVLW